MVTFVLDISQDKTFILHVHAYLYIWVKKFLYHVYFDLFKIQIPPKELQTGLIKPEDMWLRVQLRSSEESD